MKLGEIIGVAVKESVAEALRWQNGLEASCTRGLFHALGRFGLTEARAMERLAELLPAARFELLDKNRKAVFFEPGVGAAAYALAAVLDQGVVRNDSQGAGARGAALSGRLHRLRPGGPPGSLAGVPDGADGGVRRSDRAGSAGGRGRVAGEVGLSGPLPRVSRVRIGRVIGGQAQWT